ncbi:MAG: sulfurtransferase [Planctomycetota bacterium]|nr:MAG: sulfurtransferase [Planctomycetota bacterium]
MAKQHSQKFVKLVNEARSRVRECTVQDVKARLDAGEEFGLIDVREESEFARGRIPGAVHLGKGVIERDIEAAFPDPSTPLVLYCGGGYRSALAADALTRMGYTNVISMDGGWRAWNDEGFPTEAPT